MSHPLVQLSDRALKILIIILLAGQPVSIEYIKAEYKKPIGPKSITDSLRELQHEQLIARTAYRGEAFMATAHARQLILGETSAVEVSGLLHPQEPASYPQAGSETSTVEVSNLYRRGFDRLVSSSSSPPDPEEEKLPLPLEAPETSAAEVSAVLAEYGIEEPARSQLAALGYVTPDYIDSHCSCVLADGKDIVLAIYRMKNKWDARRPSEQHLSANGRERQALRRAAAWTNTMSADN